jgi:hypothetical protein
MSHRRKLELLRQIENNSSNEGALLIAVRELRRLIEADRVRAYRVRWEIDIDAPDARSAADEARTIQQDPDNLATEYEVWEPDVAAADHHRIDLSKEDG